MIIENLAKLNDWCGRAAAAAGLPATPRGIEDAAAVIWRHGFGQGLRPGDDWGWILELYPAERLREIFRESAAAE